MIHVSKALPVEAGAPFDRVWDGDHPSAPRATPNAIRRVAGGEGTRR